MVGDVQGARSRRRIVRKSTQRSLDQIQIRAQQLPEDGCPHERQCSLSVHAMTIENLRSELAQTEGQDQDTLARKVLRLVLEAGSGEETQTFSANSCPNCGRAATSARSPYCSDFCREESAFVRQFRSALASDAIADPERQAALGQKLWHLVGGGYPRRIALITPKAMAKVLQRGCELCGAPAVTVDNIGSG